MFTKEKLTLSDAPGIILTNREIKDIMKVFKSLDEFYLKELLHYCHLVIMLLGHYKQLISH